MPFAIYSIFYWTICTIFDCTRFTNISADNTSILWYFTATLCWGVLVATIAFCNIICNISITFFIINGYFIVIIVRPRLFTSSFITTIVINSCFIVIIVSPRFITSSFITTIIVFICPRVIIISPILRTSTYFTRTIIIICIRIVIRCRWIRTSFKNTTIVIFMCIRIVIRCRWICTSSYRITSFTSSSTFASFGFPLTKSISISSRRKTLQTFSTTFTVIRAFRSS